MPRIIHIQPALPLYRIDFFERLWKHYGDSLEVHFSPAMMGALTNEISEYPWAHRLGQVRNFTHGLSWQENAVKVSFGPGDVIVLSGNPRHLSTLVLLSKAHLTGAKSIWWAHHWSSSSQAWRHAIRALPMAIADSLMFYTDLEVAEYCRTLRGSRDRRPIVALNNGLDTEPIVARRDEFSPYHRDKAILFIGRLTRKANLDLGLDALHTLGLNAPHLHVIGDGEEYKALKARSDVLAISDRITWHGGTVDENQIAKVANRCRAFVYPGEVGLSLIHAMAYGLPAVVHNNRCKHMPEIAAFTSGETGANFEFNNAASLAKSIDYLLSDETRLVRWSRNACQVTRYGFNTAEMSRRFIEFVDRLRKLV